VAEGRIVRTEKRVRGVGGQIAKWLFIIFNVLMLLWMISGLVMVGNTYNAAGSSAEQAGTAIGGAIGMGMVIALWAFGDVVLGIFVLLTKGKKVIIEEAAA
jgi:hypothetical protein